MKKLVLTLAIAAALSACGGGGSSPDTTTPPDNTPTNPTPNDPTPNNPTPVTGSQTGILSDSAVQGVAYSTSSGVTGTTDAEGKYQFNPGDTVTFKLGALDLGTVPAKGLLTPIDLAGNDSTKLTNVLVVLQSLDSDGDASNGITIPSAAASAMPSLDLTASTATLTTALQTAMTTGGIDKTVKTADDATAHYLAQAVPLLAQNIWVVMDGDKPLTALRVAPNGRYLLGEVGAEDDAGKTGVERGTVSALEVGPKGYKLKGTTTMDTNGEWGLSHNQEDERFIITDTDIKISDSEITTPVPVLTKMENNPNGIVGAWLLQEPGATAPSTGQMFLFFANAYAMMVDAIGDVPEEGDTSCGGPGMELGKYTYDSQTKLITRLGNPEYNTNGCAGLWEQSNLANPTTIKFELSTDGKQAVLTGTDAGGEWTATFVRVSK